MKHRILFLLLLLPFSLFIIAENASNVRVRQQGKDIIISYDLAETSNVRLMMSVNNGAFQPLKAVDGDVGKRIKKGKGLKITWHPLQEQEMFIAENVRFQVKALKPYEDYALPTWKGGERNIETFLMGEIAYSPVPQLSYGFVVGQTYKYGLGWYVDMHSNFNFRFATNGLVCEQGGYVNKEMPFYSGRIQSSALTFHGGFIIDIFDAAKFQKNRFNSFGLYLGLGYGWRRLLWETTDGYWIEYRPTSYKGLSANFGIQGGIYGFTLRAGINTIQFKYAEMEVGLGWTF